MKKLVIFIIVLVLVAGGVYLIEKSQPETLPSNLDSSEEATRPANLKTEPKSGEWYSIQLTLKPGITDRQVFDYLSQKGLESSVGNAILDLLKVSDSKISYKMVYDVANPDPYKNYLNSRYYIPLNIASKLLPLYENDKLTAQISPLSPELIPFVSDRTYCQVDSDCSVRFGFCSYGAFNTFEPFVDFATGCENISYPQENWEILNKQCDLTTSHPEVKYSGSKCVNNKCVAQNRIITCEEGIIP